jgi:beta-barrel assembly-enhancing protease
LAAGPPSNYNHHLGLVVGFMHRRLAVILVLVVLCCGTVLTSAQADSAEKTSAGPDHQPKAYHDGSIRDLEAVGNRNVGCQRGVGNWFSLEKQIAMGRDYSQQVESTAKLISDPAVTEYVNRLAQNLVRNSDSLVPFTVKVIDSDDVNAFALPGGFFYVDSGLIVAADNEAELAGVMSHEIAHVAACHAARQNTRGQLMNLASIPLIFVGGGIGYAIQNIAGLALPLTYLKFSRAFETQADYLGLQYMYKAGYDPQAFTAFFEKVKVMEKQRPGFVAKAFETHPQTPDRIRKTQKEIDTLLPDREMYKVNTSEFDDIKARLNQIQNRRDRFAPDASRPTLRRTSSNPAADTSEGNDSDSDNGRPTLKRRREANAQ